MLVEILICSAIAFAITLSFGLTIAFCIWLDINKGIAVEISISMVLLFIIITFVIWGVRSDIRENKEKELERRKIYYRGVAKMKDIYPLTVTKDRCGGTYSGGKYTAWNLEPEENPTQIFYDDVSCLGFWLSNAIPVGIGETPIKAIKNLSELLDKGKVNKNER